MLAFLNFKIVPECSNVSKCLSEVPHWDCWCKCKPVWGTICNAIYTDNDAAKTGNKTLLTTDWTILVP